MGAVRIFLRVVGAEEKWARSVAIEPDEEIYEMISV